MGGGGGGGTKLTEQKKRKKRIENHGLVKIRERGSRISWQTWLKKFLPLNNDNIEVFPIVGRFFPLPNKIGRNPFAAIVMIESYIILHT